MDTFWSPELGGRLTDIAAGIVECRREQRSKSTQHCTKSDIRNGNSMSRLFEALSSLQTERHPRKAVPRAACCDHEVSARRGWLGGVSTVSPACSGNGKPFIARTSGKVSSTQRGCGQHGSIHSHPGTEVFDRSLCQKRPGSRSPVRLM